MIPISVGGSHDLDFLVDTGATKSALYKSSVRKLGYSEDTNSFMKIHGMNQMEDRPSLLVPYIQLGHEQFANINMAILEDRKSPIDLVRVPDGLIGMDVLQEFRIFVDARSKTFNLIPKSMPAPLIPTKWQTVVLRENPFLEDKYNLHFLEIRLGNHLIPALLDTGSEENLMNWNVSMFPQLRRARKKMREKWMIEGAVGVFKPQHLVKAENIRSGQKYWRRSEFVVMEFDGLDILGIKDQPFLIAGSALFVDQTFYLDFAENIIRFKPPSMDLRSRELLMSRTIYRDPDSTQ